MTTAVTMAMDAVQRTVPVLGIYQVDDFAITGYSRPAWLAVLVCRESNQQQAIMLPKNITLIKKAGLCRLFCLVNLARSTENRYTQGH